VVREVSQRITTRSTASAMYTGEGLPTSEVRTLDPAATAPQKNPVAVPPRAVPAGTVKLLSRHSSFAQVIGSVHWSFVFGPVGPL
jgi:hypothetical protein